jgi:ABC-type phosphate transport system permease subunit
VRGAVWLRVACAVAAAVPIGVFIALLLLATGTGLAPVAFRVLSTVELVLVAVAIATPTAVATAIYLEEYAGAGLLDRGLRAAIEALAGVPPVVHGLGGLVLFTHTLGLDYKAATATLALVLFPLIVVSTRVALQRVGPELVEGAAALGVRRWRSVRQLVLPAARLDILCGVIRATARGTGEAAPILVLGTAASEAALAPSIFVELVRTGGPSAVGTSAVLTLVGLVVVLHGAAWALEEVQG